MATNRGPYPRKGFPPRTRRRILRRDGYRCVQCGSPDQLEADHIVSHAEAKRLGWPDELIDHEDNGQTLCRTCHEPKTRAEIARGRARRKQAAKRPSEPHPGLLGGR